MGKQQTVTQILRPPNGSIDDGNTFHFPIVQHTSQTPNVHFRLKLEERMEIILDPIRTLFGVFVVLLLLVVVWYYY